MRTVSRPPQLHLPSLFCHSRSLTFRPRCLPIYSTPWKPSTQEHVPEADAEQTPEQKPEQELNLPSKPNVVDYTALKAHHDAKREAKGATVDSQVARRHAVKRLDNYVALRSAYVQQSKSAKHPQRPKVSALRAHLWRLYSIAKKHAPELLQKLWHTDWMILWSSSPIRVPRNRAARAHVEELYKDMVAAGWHPTMEQKNAYLQSLFLNGKEKEALAVWESFCGCKAVPEGVENHAFPEDPNLTATGIRILVHAQKLELAREALYSLYQKHPGYDSRVAAAVFRAHTSSQSLRTRNIAWAIYTRIREQLQCFVDKQATLKDYDPFFIGFIEARNLTKAQEVLGNMVKDGLLASDDSKEQKALVSRRTHLLNPLATDMSKATAIALHAITILPDAYHAHVFEIWMRNLLLLGFPNAVTQILEMMFNRGMEPSTYHFNLLLRGLMRTKERSYELKAENIAWHMVNASDTPRPKKGSSTSSAQDRLLQNVPPANAETYALLMDHHAKNDQWEHIDYLARRMWRENIRPNEFIMNVLMDNEARQGKYMNVWNTYVKFTRFPKDDPSVFPNGASIRCLWKVKRLAMADKEHSWYTLPSPRALLAETVRWMDKVRSRYDADSFRMGLAGRQQEAIERLVLHCFSYQKDLPGSLVALHALRDRFDVFPSHKVLETLLNHMAWVDLGKEVPDAVRGQYGLSDKFKKKKERLGQVYQILLEARLKRTGLDADAYEKMSWEEQGDLNLNMLSEFVRVVLKREYSAEEVERMIDEAKREIGLKKLRTGDIDAFSVA